MRLFPRNFDFCNSVNGGCRNLMEEILKGVVRISMAGVEITVDGERVRKSSRHLLDLASTSASASEEMSASAAAISRHANEASNAVNEAAQQTNDAALVMQQVQANMARAEEYIHKLEKQSNEINDVVQVIDDIAEQTNLLALNAAIEAARAGDAGRGFAVVADEVKKLSERSQKATAQIVETIKETQADIRHAVEAVLQSGEMVENGAQAVERVKHSMDRTEALVQEIAKSTEEQTIATSQISESVQQVVEEANMNQKMATDIANTIDSLVKMVEKERALLAEQKIPHKVLHLAKADHILWKKKMVDCAAGRCHADKTAGDHTLCRLGKWYYSEGKKKYGHMQAFKDMEAPHQKMHKVAAAALEEMERTGHVDADKYLPDIDQASQAVVKYLDMMIDEMERKGS